MRWSLALLLAGCAAGPVAPAPAIVLAGGDLDSLFAWESLHGRIPDDAAVWVPSLSCDLTERAVEWRRWSRIVSAAEPPEEVRDRLRRAGLPLEIAPAPAVTPPPAPPPLAGRARVIEFGWDIPSPAYLRAHAAAMERLPFDGVVLDVPLGGRSFSWIAFGAARLPDDAFADALADLRATRLERLRHNFLRLNVTPGDVPWDGDWSAIVSNATLAGRFVRDAGLRGLFFDTEPYQAPLWERGADALARRRGRELGEAFGREAPNATILLSFAWSHGQRHFDRLPAFLDGLRDGLPKTAELVDAYENSYGFKTREAFARGRDAIRSAGPRARVGFGLWLDFESGRRPWPASPHFSPAEFESALREARAASDGWVWVYSERLNWWTGENLPAPYRDALERAMR